MKITDVYYHASCPDGTASAVILADAFRVLGRQDINFHAVTYNDKLEQLTPAFGQLFVDITPPRSRWTEWVPFSPVVLDHHESAEQVIRGLSGVYGNNATHSGAKLAYDFVHDVLRPGYSCDSQDGFKQFAELAMIRDTWKKDHIRWVEACSQALALQFYGSKHLIELATTGRLYDNDGLNLDFIHDLGNLLFEKNLRKVNIVADGASHALIQTRHQTIKVSTFNCTEGLISDVANKLIEGGDDISVGYFYVTEYGKNKLVCSVRTSGLFSASKIAQYHGGGGHERAAGFSCGEAVNVSPGEIIQMIKGALTVQNQ